MSDCTIRPERPEDEGNLERLLDEAFGSSGRESRLWSTLRAEYPLFDPALAWVAAEANGTLQGALLLHPRDLILRGVEVPAAVLSPYAVHPAARHTGIASRLLATAAAAARDRFDLVLTLAEPGSLASHGFGRAFGQTRVRHRPGAVAEGEDAGSWEAISGPDLSACDQLYRACYGTTSGTEVRTHAALDWDSRSDHSHTLVHHRDGRVAAYLRFQLGHALTVTECGTSSRAASDALLALLGRLCREHAHESVEVLVGRSHPLLRPLLRAGGEAATHDMTGAVQAVCPAPERLLERVLGASPTASSRAVAARGLRFGLDLGTTRIELRCRRKGLEIHPGAAGPGAPTLHLQAERIVGWLTGLEPLEEALCEEDAEDPALREERNLLRDLLPEQDAMWTWSPVYDLCAW